MKNFLLAAATVLALTTSVEARAELVDEVGGWRVWRTADFGNCSATANYVDGTRVVALYRNQPAEMHLRLYLGLSNLKKVGSTVPLTIGFDNGRRYTLSAGVDFNSSLQAKFLYFRMSPNFLADFRLASGMSVKTSPDGTEKTLTSLSLKDTDRVIGRVEHCQNHKSSIAAAPPSPSSTASPARIPIHRTNGADYVVGTVNGTNLVKFMLDSGATDVALSPRLVQALRDNGTLTKADELGVAEYNTAAGPISGLRFMLRSIQVGDKVAHNVVASVSLEDTENASVLLGQSFLRKFRSWHVDNATHELVLN